ncbi:MAG: helix-turn-helix transcriptional regulator [Lachnospiraceae bacterium]
MQQDINEEILNQREIGERIYQLRTGKKFSQAKLAEKVSMSGNSISNIENGKQMCKLDKMQRFAHALDTSVNYLLYGSDTEEIKNVEEISEACLLKQEMLIEWNKLSILEQKRMVAGLKAINQVTA